MTRRTDNLRLLPEELVEINPQDAARLGIATGDAVRLASRRASIEVPAEVTERVQPGELFVAFHFPETPVNRLTSDVGDEITGCPEYKVTAVSARRA